MKPELSAAVLNPFRLYFLDHLRAALVILVILHHVAVVYGAAAPFYYVEPPVADPLAFRSLLVFVLLNQSFFMGALFLLSGYFTPGSFDRKGPGFFCRDKLIRLGIPLVAFVFVLHPISSIGYYLMPTGISGATTRLSWQEYPKLLGLGPFWFVAMLLVFSLGYAAWRGLRGVRRRYATSNSSALSYAGIAVTVLALAVLSYLARMVVPLGRSALGFPTLAYLPQYVGFFVLGIAAYRGNWFRTVSVSKGLVGLAAAGLAAVLLFPFAFSGRPFSLAVTPALRNAMGNGHWQSAVYALWDSAFAVGICLGLIVLFRRLFDGHGATGRFLSRHSYTVYIVHTPVVVFLAYSLRHVGLPNLPKFGLASIMATAISFALAFAIRRIPGFDRAL